MGRKKRRRRLRDGWTNGRTDKVSRTSPQIKTREKIKKSTRACFTTFPTHFCSFFTFEKYGFWTAFRFFPTATAAFTGSNTSNTINNNNNNNFSFAA